MSLSTHVLDAARGRPAAGLAVRLDRWDGRDGWQPVAATRTNDDGRVTGWDPGPGTHRLVFDTAGYLGEDAFYPEVAVTFRIDDPAEHYHVPLLLSPFAYSTYRGS
ncbi:5-hydroxyisourate hydrolase [Streptoalloteichus tenebrarius]|uniref:5-hydroxyisourate hydrolase n=1 Tax=Streptoalloteichus tenebrarius (strain ATCC 17920 / DSM 40477 / JCM 4838 / CBS 697.72 / NBRC 16177 / NCIMB 11028 / NRRL B-12390 / A12253. 1 / ISP 5477) TaxID=1933 RepID=A0ABT1I1W0_STRSD|nr:hydroxyisourate hydrolase [Streptoalloteichus tenebrarius]MCP2261771.1 5-hydroxyisourate hydrolase [Streptoalloteichus tenebrarius]BFF00828.1 hydroxyisourate hydrolase [Streptoalloteichus tenebrarius]